MTSTAPGARLWWKEGVAYQIWPTSYKDSNGDGIGDIPGIISTLDYLKDLGVDYIWLSPMYESPQNDMGYDISNYERVHSAFGTMEDMDALIREVHSRDMKLILDLVVNHTSNAHKWFQESRKGKDNEYSDWYIWRDAVYTASGERRPPNNWMAFFGGSCWTWDEERQQYFFHLFLESMPDLNWENERTRHGIYNSAIKFWLDKGLDGFRIDVINLYCKDQTFPSMPVPPGGDEGQLVFPDVKYVCNGPKMHEWLKEQRVMTLDKYDKDFVLVGELGAASVEEVIRYISPASREIDTIFDFSVTYLGGAFGMTPWHEWRRHTLPEVKKGLLKAQQYIQDHGAWATVFLENHDSSRSVSRFGSTDPAHRIHSAKCLALLLVALSGTLFLLQGQEIGMTTIPRDWDRSEWRDVMWINFAKQHEAKYPNDPEAREGFLNAWQMLGRDHARTPVQWSAEEHAGFSTVKPWMRVNDNYREINVTNQLKDKNSVHAYWKTVLALRKEHKNVLIYGHTEFVDVENTNTITFVKSAPSPPVVEGEDGPYQILACFNHSETPQPVFFPDTLKDKSIRLLSTTETEEEDPGDPEMLGPWVGKLFQMY